MYNASELKDLIEKSIESYIPESEKYSSLLEESESYSLSSGGKRLRPCILLAVCQMFEGDVKEAIPFAVALEMIHTYSLIHDDLPAMDNDDYRRGMLSNHKKFGEDTAILSGDALLTRAFMIMSGELCIDTSQGKSLAMESISSSAYDMIRGQIADIKAPRKPSQKYLSYVNINKTSALFRAAFFSGAYIANASEKETLDMRKAGEAFGIAFQIADDISDLGKDESLNYAELFGKEKAISEFNKNIDVFKDIIGKYKNNKILLKICDLGAING